ncbi:MAG: glycosyltransferase family 39 protein [Sedimentisphaerales bacterium]
MTGKTQIKKNFGASSKSSLWCWLAIALIIIGAAAIRWHLVTMPLERDEGEYAYIAQQMLKGVPPYESAYSMKLPGIYAVYAIFLAAFGQTITAIHLGLIIFNAATIVVIFLLARYMFGGIAGIATGAFYAILSVVGTTLGFTANAEHFVLLPALIGILLIVKHPENRSISYVFWTALLFGLAFIIKQHGIFFALFGGLYLLFSSISNRPVEWKKIISEQLVFIAGVIIPYALVCLYFWQAGLFSKFWFWTVTYAHAYSSIDSLAQRWQVFKMVIKAIVSSSVLIWLLFLTGLMAIIARKNWRGYATFVFGFLVFSVLAVCPGFYFRPHYFIFLFPVTAVVAGAGFGETGNLFGKLFAGTRRALFIAVVGLVVVGVCIYQQRLYLFKLSPSDVCQYFYRGHPFLESVGIADYIKKNSSPNDSVAVLGSEPQIYFYSERRSATRYIYTYPLTEPHRFTTEMKNEMFGEITSAAPKFIVVVNNTYSWFTRPGSLKEYKDFTGRVESYASKFYTLAGIIDMRWDGPTVYRWDADVAGYHPVSDFWIAVFRRK